MSAGSVVRDALIAAVTSGELAGLETMLERDPALAATRDEHGVSVLLLALYHRQPGARDALLAAGAPIGAPEAAALGDVVALRALLDADPDALRARGGDGFTPLHLAAFFGGAEAVRLLLGAGAEADADNDNTFGVRPIHSAASVGDVEAVRALLEAGADPNVRQGGGYTPLLAAAHSDNAELAALLLAHGADPALAADDGRDARALAGPAVRALLNSKN
jgi:ankyrin repeat protein